MQQRQLIAVLVILGTTLVVSLPVNSPPIKDNSSFKAVESIADTEDDNSSSTLPTATTRAPVNDSESSTNITQSNHTWPSMEDPNLFEGDMKVSKEIIDKYYGKLKEGKENSTNSTKVGLRIQLLSLLLHNIIMLQTDICYAESSSQICSER